MKVLLFILVTTPLVFSGPAQIPRRYFKEENDPHFKRFIPIENEIGEIKIVDLLAEENVNVRVSVSDVEYDLYTAKNTKTPFLITNNNVDRLASSNFDPKKLSIFVAHGWNNNRNSAVNTNIRGAIFGNHDVNLFVVDWSGPANKNYLSAKGSVVEVGRVIGQFINAISQKYGLSGSSFVFIGHSLGAHVAGSAGATTTSKLGNIIGLDPAGPLFSLNNLGERLDTSDATVVQVIHTNGNLLGFASSIGDIDYFPNGGMVQPGCGWDFAGTCAHSKAYYYMAEALTRGAVFKSLLCDSYSHFQKGSCARNAESFMGEVTVTTRYLGDYYLDTNDKEPYGLH